MRRSLLIFGRLALAAVWLGPLPQIGRQTFRAHMTMHMVVVAVAAPLLAFAVAGGKFDPVPQAPKLFAPIPASIVELIVVWAWHAPLALADLSSVSQGVVTGIGFIGPSPSSSRPSSRRSRA